MKAKLRQSQTLTGVQLRYKITYAVSSILSQIGPKKSDPYVTKSGQDWILYHQFGLEWFLWLHVHNGPSPAMTAPSRITRRLGSKVELKNSKKTQFMAKNDIKSFLVKMHIGFQTFDTQYGYSLLVLYLFDNVEINLVVCRIIVSAPVRNKTLDLNQRTWTRAWQFKSP